MQIHSFASSSSTSKRNDKVDELNRRNSALSATDTYSSEYIPYGKTKNVTTSSNESQLYDNGMRGIPTVASSRSLFY